MLSTFLLLPAQTPERNGRDTAIGSECRPCFKCLLVRIPDFIGVSVFLIREMQRSTRFIAFFLRPMCITELHGFRSGDEAGRPFEETEKSGIFPQATAIRKSDSLLFRKCLHPPDGLFNEGTIRLGPGPL